MVSPDRASASAVVDEQEIRSEEASVVYKTPLALLASLINGVFCVGVLWQVVPRPLLLGWALAVALVPGACARCLLRKTRRRARPRPQGPGQPA